MSPTPIRLDDLMPSPRNRPVPRFAPEGSITLVSALDIFGRAVDPAWTGKEFKADTGRPVRRRATGRPYREVNLTHTEIPRSRTR
jgi:hypothetical protein